MGFQQIECLGAVSDTWWRPQLSAVGRNHIKSVPHVQEASNQNDLRGLNIMKMCRNLSKSHKYPCAKRANHLKARLTHLVVSGSGSRLCHHQGTILPAPWFTWLFSPRCPKNHNTKHVQPNISRTSLHIWLQIGIYRS